MYKVITFRSRKLKKNTIKLYDAADESSAAICNLDEDAIDQLLEKSQMEKLTKKERKMLKKALKEREELEYNEEDLSEDDAENLRMDKIINVDNFYTALEPIDAGTIEKKSRFDKRKTIAAVGLIGLILIITVVIVFVIGNNLKTY